VRDEVLGHQVQLGVYRPDELDERSTAAVRRRQARALAAANKAAAALMKVVFGCEHDGCAALDLFKREQRDEMLRIDGDVVSETVAPKRPRGRPKKSEAPAPTKTQYRLHIRVDSDEDAVKTAVERENCFVVLHTGMEPITARALLEQYKGQVVVEKRFPFLKDPAWAEVFFLKTPSRVEALGYVLLLALLVWSVWERRVRANLERSGEPPIRDTPGGLKTKPTAMVCRHILTGIKAVRVRNDQGWTPWQPAAPFNAEQMRVIRFSAPVPVKRLRSPGPAALPGGP
jgi:transposase